MSIESCGYSLLLALPDDVFSIVTRSLTPKDICNLGLCCRGLYGFVASEKVWFTQCQNLGFVPQQDLVQWRIAVSSYKSLCRFLYSVKPLIGIWVHQNPELGNVVYVMPGFVSIVGCRIIPQELGPLGIEDGPILWAPVFEIFGDCDGETVFFLHGREKGIDYVYPGSVKSIDVNCNVMLLEVEPRFDDNERFGIRSSQGLAFSRLAFSDRRKLLELVTSQVRLKLTNSVMGCLFPGICKDLEALYERRLALIRMHKLGRDNLGSFSDPIRVELSVERTRGVKYSASEEEGQAHGSKRKSLAKYFWYSIGQMLGKSNVNSSGSKNGCSSSESKHIPMQEFLKSGDRVELTFHASTVKLSSYRAWPNMHDSRFALYKLPLRSASPEQEFAGLWGGTFGWPPGKPTEDKPGKALFFLLLSYEENQGRKVLIATKILEGTHYVLHPNGSAMFMVNVDEFSQEAFPWEIDGDSEPVSVSCALVGEGIANGYGFRYPGSKPGSLFVFENGHLAFLWKESRVVLTLQRLDLQELLRKGEKVPALPPIANFSYLTKSYSNVFAGFPSSSNSFSSQRYRH